MAEGPRAEERACSTRLHRLFLRVPKATLDILGAYGEALFRAIFGLELDSGKAWRRKSLGTGVDQPEDPWEVRDRILEALPTTRGVSVTAGGLKRCGRLEKAEERACSTLRHRLVLRVPKATLDILGAYGEVLFRAIFGVELDGGKAWRRKSLGTGVYQPEDPWEVRDRLLEALPTTRGQAPKPFPGPLAADACTAALAAKAGPGTGVATSRAVSQFFLMGFEGDVRESGLKPSSAAGRAVGQAPKPFPGPLAADACTAALAAEAGPGVAT